ncbi:MAG: hypothetical protein M3011_04300 [Actinomycetota bacterium]|nr:hypothetical protein [Actinomycetota bacterium]
MDERRHQPGPERDWEESWSFDFVSGNGSFGGFVRLALHPAQQRAWYWAYLARRGAPVVVVRDHDVDAPRGRELEIRGDGLWAQVICETPFEHWSAGLEAFAVAIDDPARAWGDERGDPTALGLDLEWEMRAPATTLAEPGYVQPATVHGDVLLGAERLAVDGTGWYTHAWGLPGWQDRRWWAVSATFDDGTALSARAPGWISRWPSGDGSGVRDPARSAGSLDTVWRSDGLPDSARLVAGDAETRITPVALAPVPLEAAGRRRGVLMRALCSVSDGDNGGWGWSEWLRPQEASAEGLRPPPA